jgi:hypothetical protein
VNQDEGKKKVRDCGTRKTIFQAGLVCESAKRLMIRIITEPVIAQNFTQ